ncbi:hypothetical protein RSAG8_08993, partial [Rhizoctonia solani AG-8 WAC10335]
MDFVFTLASLSPVAPSTRAIEDSSDREGGSAPRDFDKGSGYCVVASPVQAVTVLSHYPQIRSLTFSSLFLAILLLIFVVFLHQPFVLQLCCPCFTLFGYPLYACVSQFTCIW